MIRHHERITRAAALTLALTAIAASPALATPPPASPGPCSEVCSGGGYGPVPSQPAATPTSTQPRSKIANPGPCSEVCSGSGYGPTVNRPAATPTSTGPGSDVSSTNGYDFARVPPTVVRIIAGDSGFDWGDAGIGAGAALGLMLAAAGGTLLLAHRRTQSRTAS
jgi:hypothetical protein